MLLAELAAHRKEEGLLVTAAHNEKHAGLNVHNLSAVLVGEPVEEECLWYGREGNAVDGMRLCIRPASRRGMGTCQARARALNQAVAAAQH